MLIRQRQLYTRTLLMGVVLTHLPTCTINASTETADMILHNGAIYTVNEAQRWAESVAVKDGKILFVGSNREVVRYQGKQTRIIELEGQMVLPGFQDSHLHPLEAGSEVGTTCELWPDAPPDDFIDTFRECVPKQKGTHWVLGGGHSIYKLLESVENGRFPIDILDEAIPDRPAAMLEETSHSAWVNSKALAAIGFDENTPNPPGGVIHRHPDSGELTGILFENAGNMVLDMAFARSKAMDQLTYEGLLYGLQKLAQNGITSMADARTYWQRGHLEAWQRAEREGKLTARTVLGLWAYPHAYDDDEQIDLLISMYRNQPESLLRVSQVKIYSDGIVGNGTAALLEPYNDSLGITSLMGLNYFDKQRLTHYVTELEKVGFDMHIHTIGDRAVREALDAIEAAQKVNGDSIKRRHRLTHLESIDPADRPRFAKLGVIADFQLAGEFTEPAHAQAENEPFIGKRAFDMFPVKSLYDTGAKITLSSDWDVSDLPPFIGIERAVKLGKLPNLAAAIRAYTINAAFLMRQEKLTGSIEVGKYADLVVIDQNLFEIPVEKIDNTRVLLTLLGGKIVYPHPDFCNEQNPGGRFDSATNMLHIPELNAMSMGTYAVTMALVGTAPKITFELRSADKVEKPGNSSCAAYFDDTSRKLLIPMVKVDQKVFIAELNWENVPGGVFRFALAFLYDLTYTA
ncbi:MAG: amidohydrolase [Candidatus Parabeggiatoa sp. nov. 1]|nr:MAG: amidohydrolase [Gammaproteobacteria bacterium]